MTLSFPEFRHIIAVARYRTHVNTGRTHTKTGLPGRLSMFESLDEQLKLDAHKSMSNTEQ